LACKDKRSFAYKKGKGKAMDKRWFYSLKFCLFSLIIHTCSGVTPLPKGLVTLSNNKKNSTITVPDNNKDVIFCIIVPEIFNDQAFKGLESFSKNITVEKDFLTAGPAMATKPIILFFEWQEAENAQIRKQAGQDLAAAMNDLKNRFKESQYIFIGIGQGGNVINLASNSTKNKFDMVIQLLTPIFPFDLQNNYADYAPNASTIQNLFCFYSDHAFTLPHPTLHPNYTHFYPDTVANKSTILLLIENQHAKKNALLAQDGQKFLTVITQINTKYPLHKKKMSKFAAHLSTKKIDTNNMVFIIDPVIDNNDPASKKEEELSDSYKKIFEGKWGRPMTLSLNTGEKTRALNKSTEEAATKS
jgi:hypothetical protein